MSRDEQGRPIRLITVSREFGAGGSELAREVGRLLDWPVLDHDIVHRVADRLRLDDGTVERFDEHPPSLLARIASVLIVLTPEMYSFAAPIDVPSHDAIAAATRHVIEDAAASLPVIVVGHGAQCIFAGRPDALHVRLVAPPDVRVRRIAQRMNTDPATVSAIVQRADHDRQAYVQRYFHSDVRGELLYDLRINTGRIAIGDAAAIVSRLVESRPTGDDADTLPGGHSS